MFQQALGKILLGLIGKLDWEALLKAVMAKFLENLQKQQPPGTTLPPLPGGLSMTAEDPKVAKVMQMTCDDLLN